MAARHSEHATPMHIQQPVRSYRIRDQTFLRLKRESRNLSQADLAKFIGVSRSAVARWESVADARVAQAHAELITIVLDEPMKALFTPD